MSSKKGRGIETAVVGLADIHFGKHDLNTTKKRLDHIGRQIAEVKKENPCKYDRLIILLLGDLVDGEGIYPGQPHQQKHSNALEQVEECAQYMAGWTRRQMAVWGNIVIECVGGNHGRTSKHNHPNNNYDVATYLSLSKLLDRDGIDVNYVDDRRDYFLRRIKVRRWSHLLWHGHEIRNSGGTTPVNAVWQRVLRWTAATYPGKPNVVWMGHFHTAMISELNSIQLNMCGTAVTDDRHALTTLGFESSNTTWMIGASDAQPVTWIKKLTYV